MIAANAFSPRLIDVTGLPKPIVGLPDGVVKYRVRFRAHNAPVIFLKFIDRIQKHILLCRGDVLEPFAMPEAVNIVS